MKYEWRKKDKHIYLPKNKPEIIELKPQNYLTIKGQGNPNTEQFQKCVQALYQVSYAIKMSYKTDTNIEGYYDYTVFPLEGFWTLSEDGVKKYQEGTKVIDMMEELVFHIMIRQPDFVTSNWVEHFKEVAHKKKPNNLIKNLKLESIKEGLSCQMLHIGPYKTEDESFKIMEDYCVQNGYERLTKEHKEIYISDPSRVAPEKLKTTIRFKVKKQD